MRGTAVGAAASILTATGPAGACMTPAREGAGDTVGVGVGDGWER
jgi:hypothetical protein